MIKQILIGFIIGVIANLAGLYLYVYLFTDYEIEVALRLSYQDGFIGKLIALGAVLNFLPFFVFIKKKQDYRARGVLIATILSAILILISKIIDYV
ncbi:hypothetical protein SAMN05444278_10692 [Psychroflexus salarius]|uniref:Uncharacterized protein n=1 Tax=Psychroflexus salarius TaxID=1155689 RepID=A0A1M4WP44_9FLAO|nr:hypothetical protein [Psychroflexus salarius]SHE82995.1 hypothetical protein SAMN05444278_10692 [Psychroflexus salarius]